MGRYYREWEEYEQPSYYDEDGYIDRDALQDALEDGEITEEMYNEGRWRRNCRMWEDW